MSKPAATEATALKSAFACVRAFLAIFMAVVLVVGLAPFTPLTPAAYAAGSTKADSVMLKIGSDNNQIDVTKNVATLDSQKGDTELVFTVKDSYSSLDAGEKRREILVLDSKGNVVQTAAASGKDEVRFNASKLGANQQLMLVTSAKGSGSSALARRYKQQLNVRVADTKKAETGASTGGNAVGGISEEGGQWSFSNGLQYTFKNTGFKFLDDTTMNLGALRLPLTYKHNPDGTTIVGINANPEDKAFYEAVKNGNVWQKYSSEKMAEMTKQMDKGWSGKDFGSWGGKKFDWNICGYMEYNTNKPDAPRAVNLVISMGMKAEGHAQYLCFTGTLTFSIGGKATLTGKLTPAKGVEGKFNLGAYAGLELYIGIGLNYVASVGGYGKGQIDIDFQMLPQTQLEKIILSGELGAKAKLFGFTIYTWKILDGKKPLYERAPDKKLSGQSEEPAFVLLGVAHADEPDEALNEDGAATSPFEVSADTAYPVDARDYLNGGSGLIAAGSDALEAQEATSSDTILKGIYGETELAGTTTNNGPVIVYIADAEQVSGGGDRDSYNRSVLVYSRQKSDGSWTEPAIIDNATSSKDFADYCPAITTDGDNCYVTWLSADSKIDEGATIGQVGNKLDVSVATITKDDKVTVESVCEESDDTKNMPASPVAKKVGDDLYVGWYTNETTGSEGQVIGLSGTHKIRLFKRGSDGKWADTATTSSIAQSGAITSFDVGTYGDTAACVWSLDTALSPSAAPVSLNGVSQLANSSVYALSPGSTTPAKVAGNATNAQFAMMNGAELLTYTVQNAGSDDQAAYYSIMSSPSPGATGSLVLDGSKVNLPTSSYIVAGDLGKARNGNVSFLSAGDGSSDIQTLVTTGAGSSDWTSVVEATVEQDVVTDYCSMYSKGLPLFVYTTEPVGDAQGMTGQADTGGANLNQSTEDSLKHLSVEDADFDEYLVKSGEKMPVKVYFTNDGMLDVSGTDLWVLQGDTVTKAASNDETVELDGEGSIEFEYAVPAKETFTKRHEFTVYAAPKGANVTASTINHAKEIGAAMTLSVGGPSLAVQSDLQIVDDKESIATRIVNDGIVPHDAKLLYLNGETGETLASFDVPVLEEDGVFEHTYAAPKGYFQNDGIDSVIVTLKEEGDDAEGYDSYDINHTEFISTWTPITGNDSADEQEGDDGKDAKSNTATKTTSTKSSVPATGDNVPVAVVLGLLVLAIGILLIAARALRKGAGSSR